MNLRAAVTRRRSNYFGIFLALLIFIFFATFWYSHIEKGIFSLMEHQITLHGQMINSMEILPEENDAFILERLNEHSPSGVTIALLKEREVINEVQPAIEWTNNENQELRLAANHLHNEGPNQEGVTEGELISWNSNRSYHIAAPFNFRGENFWLLEVQPAGNFNQAWYSYWLTLALTLLMGLAIVAFVFNLFISHLRTPLKSLDAGLKRLALDDYSYEYIGNSLPEIDRLGATTTRVVRVFEKKVMRLYSSQQQLSLLLDNINLGVLVINPQGKIEMFNPAVAQILLLEPSAIGKSYQTAVKSFLLINLISNVREHGQAIQEEIEVFIPKSRYIDVNILSYQKSNSEEQSVLVLLYDISEIRRLETVRTEFVANASHELRTPVTAIKGFAETLLSGAMHDSILSEKFINIIATESNRLEMIISDILELSRVEKHPTILRKTTFDIVKVTQNIVVFLSQKLEDKTINVSIKGDAQVNFTGDQHRIEQIITNLIDNAINYSDINSQITITLKTRKKGINISIADTGIGIPPLELDRIFERFYRVDKGRSRNSGGTGLGLAIVRNLVKSMQGKIEVESKVGIGTKFIIYIPY